MSRRRRPPQRVAALARDVVLGALAAAVCFAGAAFAHVGSPDTWFEGAAGAYPIRVVVRAPGVVPGLAEIDVRVLAGRADRIGVQPFAWNAGEGGAPPPDAASPVPGDPQLWSVRLWLMSPTSYGVHVTVSGDRGSGLAIVPVQAVATRRLPMDGGLVVVLLALAAFLVAGLVTIVGAAVRDSSVPAGQAPDARRVRRARIAMAVSAVVLVVALGFGRRWWNAVDRAHAADMYRPFHVTASFADSAGGPWVRLLIDDEQWRGHTWTPLIPDHGKLMHLFLVSTPDPMALAHLHPVPIDSSTFVARLPELPPGKYRVFADIVHESGFAQTLTTTIGLPASPATPLAAGLLPPVASAVAGVRSRARTEPLASPPPTDHDDSWFSGNPVPEKTDTPRFELRDGGAVIWEHGAGPIVANTDHPLRFRVVEANGAPATLDPYMGMAAHVIVLAADGSVFAHLHPMGTVSMGAQQAIAQRTPADSLAGTLGRRLTAQAAAGMAMPMESPASEFTIPYGFPHAGRYRMWVQFRRRGVIETAAFELQVAPEPSRS